MKERSKEFLLIGIGNTRVALAASAVIEAIRPVALTRVPHAPALLLGLANLRGTVLPVISLAALLDMPAGGATKSARIVVVDCNGRIGLWVDAVLDLTAQDDCAPVPLAALLARDFGAMVPQPSARRHGQIADTQAAPARTRNERALIAFCVNRQDYALPLADVAEIIALPRDIAAVPGSDAAMLGAVAWRGGTLPLVSLRALLGLPPADHERMRHARSVVTRIGGTHAGLVVDSMRTILRVPEQDIDPVPDLLVRRQAEARIDSICRLESGRRLVLLLSPTRLFDSATAARLLTAEQNADISSSVAAARGAAQEFIVFWIGDEHYGLPIDAVDEVVRHPAAVTGVPHAPPYLLGMMNLRGRALPLIDQRRRLGGASAGTAPRVIVVTVHGVQAGFCVDGVSSILRADPAELAPAPKLSSSAAALFDRIAGIERGGRMILLIDPTTLMNDAARDLLAALAYPGAVVPA